MITKIIDENSISVIPEDSDDLLNLRRIIKEEDKVIGDTTRVLKQDKDKKVIIFKYKAKKREKTKKGHRQPFTEVEITQITS